MSVNVTTLHPFFPLIYSIFLSVNLLFYPFLYDINSSLLPPVSVKERSESILSVKTTDINFSRVGTRTGVVAVNHFICFLLYPCTDTDTGTGDHGQV